MFLNERRNNVSGHRLSKKGFGLTAHLLLTSMAMVIFACALIGVPIAEVHALATPKKVYRYFGYGSNVIPSTMKALRQIEVREVTAAILPDFELTFRSAAFVRPMHVTNQTVIENNANEEAAEDRHDVLRSDRVVHGILYTLTEEEFAKVGQTEGVPFGYRWQKCHVYPYRGDGKTAGMDCLQDPDALCVQAYTLVEPTPASSQQKQQQQRRTQKQLKQSSKRGSVPPSVSYLGLIREGARLWKFDRDYQDKLAAIKTAASGNFLFPDGWEGPTLELAEKATGTKRTYMIDGY